MEVFGPILFALLVLGSVGHALYKKYKDHRTSKRVADMNARMDADRERGWVEQIPPLLEASRQALEQLGLQVEEASRRECLLGWGYLMLPEDTDPDTISPDERFAGVTGRGVLDDLDVAITISASDARTFSYKPHLSVLWYVDLRDRIPGELQLDHDAFRWDEFSIHLLDPKREGDFFLELFEGFAEALEELEARDAVTVQYEPYRLEAGHLRFCYHASASSEVGALAEAAAYGRTLPPTVAWPEQWCGVSESLLGFLEVAAADSLIFSQALEELRERPKLQGRLRDILIERANTGDGHAVQVLVRYTPDLVERLETERLPEFLIAAHAASTEDSSSTYDVSWALPHLPPERWLTLDAPLSLRADIITALLERKVDIEQLRAAADEVFNDEDLSTWHHRRMLDRVGDNPALLRAACAAPARLCEELEREDWESAPSRRWRNYILNTARDNAERARDESNLEPCLLELLHHLEDDHLLMTIEALGVLGGRASLTALHTIEEDSIGGMGAAARAAARAKEEIIARIGDVAHGGLSLAEGDEHQGALSVAPGATGALTLDED